MRTTGMDKYPFSFPEWQFLSCSSKARLRPASATGSSLPSVGGLEQSFLSNRSWDANAGDAFPLPGRVLILDGRVLEYPHKCNSVPARPFDPLLSFLPPLFPSGSSFKNRTYLASQLLRL